MAVCAHAFLNLVEHLEGLSILATIMEDVTTMLAG